MRHDQNIQAVNRSEYLTIEQLAYSMHVSRSTIERHVRDGMPAIDVGIRRPGRRQKRCLRFDRGAVVKWLEGRRGAPAA
jgi:hypothetical protein